jgi:hypothetical protein
LHTYLATAESIKPIGSCQVHVLGVHSGRGTLFHLFNNHISICNCCYNNPYDKVKAHHRFFVYCQLLLSNNISSSNLPIWLRPTWLNRNFDAVTTTHCRCVSHECSCRFQNIFRCCATLIILLKFNNLIKLYLPPT